MDVVILLLEQDKLHCDQLQFGFQPKSSTTMCSWLVTSVVDKYNRMGSEVFCCTMDLSKAFDMVEWDTLFKELLERGVSALYLRGLLYVYRMQSCIVSWNGFESFKFNVTNGVRQGAVSSPVLFSIYIDKLFEMLRQSGLGCRIANVFYGCFGYADDLLLLSASRSGLQGMVDLCSRFMKQRGLKFSTNPIPMKSKTKCIVFSKKKTTEILPIKLNGDNLPWVDEIKYLGNVLECNNSMKRDMQIKRGKFIGKVNALLQELHFCTPETLMKMINIYCTSFYGSGLWNLTSPECERLFKAWNVTIRKVWGLPNTTHRYLIEPISAVMHPKVMLARRYTSFVSSLLSSPKFAVRLMAHSSCNDLRTVMGKCLLYISRECGYRCWTEGVLKPIVIKKYMKYFPVPDDQQWRVGLIQELLTEDLQVEGFADSEIKEMVDYLCVN